MAKVNNKNQRSINSRQFERARLYLSEGAKLRIKEFNPGKTENSRNKASERMRSDRNPMKMNPEKNPFLGKSFVKGRKWFNNGVENLYIDPAQGIPDGFVPGMKSYKSIRNGVESNH